MGVGFTKHGSIFVISLLTKTSHLQNLPPFWYESKMSLDLPPCHVMMIELPLPQENFFVGKPLKVLPPSLVSSVYYLPSFLRIWKHWWYISRLIISQYGCLYHCVLHSISLSHHGIAFPVRWGASLTAQVHVALSTHPTDITPSKVIRYATMSSTLVSLANFVSNELSSTHLPSLIISFITCTSCSIHRKKTYMNMDFYGSRESIIIPCRDRTITVQVC